MSCLLLEGSLPDSIDGVPIYPDYRNMIRFEQILEDDTLTDEQKTLLAAAQLFDRLPPGGIARAADRLQWFYSRGKAPDAGDKKGSQARAWDLAADAGCIYAAFLQAYGIDLVRVPFLHWWAFLELLENLPEQTLMAQKMQLRTMDLSEIKDAKLRERYKKLQRQAALPPRRGRKDNAAETLAQRVQRRHAEAKQQLERRKADGV